MQTYHAQIAVNMEAKHIRLCVECGKSHNTGIEDRMEGTFEPVDTCIDCLMGKFSFRGCYITS